MVCLDDLVTYLGDVRVLNQGNNYIITRNGMVTVFNIGSCNYTSSIYYTTSAFNVAANDWIDTVHSLSVSGETDVPTQYIDGKCYVACYDAVLQLGALYAGYVSYGQTETTYDVFDVRVSGTTPLEDNHYYIVGGPWLNNWDNFALHNLSDHFVVEDFWDLSTNSPDNPYKHQLKVAKDLVQVAENVSHYYNDDNSGYGTNMEMKGSTGFRSWIYNLDVNSSATTRHIRGLAFDAGKDDLFREIYQEEFANYVDWNLLHITNNNWVNSQSKIYRIERMYNEDGSIRDSKGQIWLHAECFYN